MNVACILLPLALLSAAPLVAAEPIPVPAFRSLELRGGGTVIVRPGPAASVTLIEGSPQVTAFRVDGNGQLKIDACNARCPRHYRLTVAVTYPSVLPMGVKGGGKISVEPGFAPQRQVAAGVGGGGLIDLRSVTAGTAAAGVNGGGKILLGRSATVAAAVSGGGEILYAGDPKVTTVVNGGGIVRRAQ